MKRTLRVTGCAWWLFFAGCGTDFSEALLFAGESAGRTFLDVLISDLYSDAPELVVFPGAGLIRVLPGHLHVAPERNRAHAIVGVAAPHRQQLRTESDRKGQDAHAQTPRHHVMAELVHEHENAQDEYERHQTRQHHSSTRPGCERCGPEFIIC